ncbi:MAG: hypothetical protein SFW35_03155 [Chitinophagales bacterium]|nr:hypothetical protein [Chitinophagales bacterium]
MNAMIENMIDFPHLLGATPIPDPGIAVVSPIVPTPAISTVMKAVAPVTPALPKATPIANAASSKGSHTTTLVVVVVAVLVVGGTIAIAYHYSNKPKTIRHENSKS